jgi:hypothetical protein
MALTFVTSPPLLAMNSMSKLGVRLNIIDESYALSPWDSIGF